MNEQEMKCKVYVFHGNSAGLCFSVQYFPHYGKIHKTCTYCLQVLACSRGVGNLTTHSLPSTYEIQITL
jgi:hypothetical protein